MNKRSTVLWGIFLITICTCGISPGNNKIRINAINKLKNTSIIYFYVPHVDSSGYSIKYAVKDSIEIKEINKILINSIFKNSEVMPCGYDAAISLQAQNEITKIYINRECGYMNEHNKILGNWKKYSNKLDKYFRIAEQEGISDTFLIAP
jgi:hypothetical protein